MVTTYWKIVIDKATKKSEARGKRVVLDKFYDDLVSGNSFFFHGTFWKFEQLWANIVECMVFMGSIEYKTIRSYSV